MEGARTLLIMDELDLNFQGHDLHCDSQPRAYVMLCGAIFIKTVKCRFHYILVCFVTAHLFEINIALALRSMNQTSEQNFDSQYIYPERVESNEDSSE